MPVNLVWATPDGDRLVAKLARVSNPDNQDNPDTERLICYLVRNKHWSPFEMVSACLEITTTRDIGRQILRHRSFSFQEFSQRYQDATQLGDWELRECRLQDEKNRQSSLACNDSGLEGLWYEMQDKVATLARESYQKALARGIAKEQARAILPEGLTPSRLYMAGTLRSWLHFIQVRATPETQAECRVIAEQAREVLRHSFPETMRAVEL